MARRQELIAHLGNVPLFSRCSKRDLQIIARHTETVDVPEGTEVVVEGDDGDAFFVILTGKTSVWRSGRRVRTLAAGDYFGELALLDPAPRSATVAADTDVLIAVLGARMFRTILREVPAMNERLLAALARQVRDLDMELDS